MIIVRYKTVDLRWLLDWKRNFSHPKDYFCNIMKIYHWDLCLV